jgi:dTDP-4-amino-4,6-dideoxygalactose transaminase
VNNHEFIELFEEGLAEYTGAPYVVLTDSCSNAIFLSVKLDGIALVSIPKNTYVSVPMQLTHAGCSISYNEEQWEGMYNITPTKVFDAAQRFTSGMYIKGTKMCVSFQQKKILNIGKGGAILLDSHKDYLALKRMAWDGRDASIPVEEDRGIILGYHMNMTPEVAAKGLLLLNRLPELNSDNGSWKDYPDISKINLKASAL